MRRNKHTGFTPSLEDDVALRKQPKAATASFSAGFTLVELLVVISIIGLLASIVTASFGNARLGARDSQRAAQARQFERALETYFIANGSYPCALNTCTTSVQPFSPANNTAGAVLVSQGYISSIPGDPLYPVGTNTDCNVAGGNGYCYCSNGGGYVLTINTEADQGGSDRCYIRAGNFSSLCTGHQTPGTWATQACSERF